MFYFITSIQSRRIQDDLMMVIKYKPKAFRQNSLNKYFYSTFLCNKLLATGLKPQYRITQFKINKENKVNKKYQIFEKTLAYKF